MHIEGNYLWLKFRTLAGLQQQHRTIWRVCVSTTHFCLHLVYNSETVMIQVPVFVLFLVILLLLPHTHDLATPLPCCCHSGHHKYPSLILTCFQSVSVASPVFTLLSFLLLFVLDSVFGLLPDWLVFYVSCPVLLFCSSYDILPCSKCLLHTFPPAHA